MLFRTSSLLETADSYIITFLFVFVCVRADHPGGDVPHCHYSVSYHGQYLHPEIWSEVHQLLCEYNNKTAAYNKVAHSSRINCVCVRVCVSSG